MSRRNRKGASIVVLGGLGSHLLASDSLHRICGSSRFNRTGRSTAAQHLLRQGGCQRNLNDPDPRSPRWSDADADEACGSMVDRLVRSYASLGSGNLGGSGCMRGMGIVVLMERMVRLRSRRVMPSDFTARFVDRLHEGKLDCGQALDFCERNPSPAARVALAAVRRWGRPATDLERAVTLAHRVETERLRRNVGTLRRVAALAALLGVLGTLFALGPRLEAIPPSSGIAARTSPAIAWGPALAAAITPLSTGILIATLALVAYDGVLTHVETLAGALDRLGAETIEAIALSAASRRKADPSGPDAPSVETAGRSGDAAGSTTGNR